MTEGSALKFKNILLVAATFAVLVVAIATAGFGIGTNATAQQATPTGTATVAGATVTPPRTGTGLMGTDSSGDLLPVLAVGGAVLAAGAGIAFAVSRR